MTEYNWKRKTTPIAFLEAINYPAFSEKQPVQLFECVPVKDAEEALDKLQREIDALKWLVAQYSEVVAVARNAADSIGGGSAWGYDIIPTADADVLRLAIRHYDESTNLYEQQQAERRKADDQP